jgi:hypothetical protein
MKKYLLTKKKQNIEKQARRNKIRDRSRIGCKEFLGLF